MDVKFNLDLNLFYKLEPILVREESDNTQTIKAFDFDKSSVDSKAYRNHIFNSIDNGFSRNINYYITTFAQLYREVTFVLEDFYKGLPKTSNHNHLNLDIHNARATLANSKILDLGCFITGIEHDWEEDNSIVTKISFTKDHTELVSRQSFDLQTIPEKYHDQPTLLPGVIKSLPKDGCCVVLEGKTISKLEPYLISERYIPIERDGDKQYYLYPSRYNRGWII